MADKNYKVGFIFGAKKGGGFDTTVKGIVKGLAGIATAYVGINTIKGAVDTFATFEQSMANVKAISGATAEEFAMLETAALDMGRATSKTAAEAADALGYMSLAGWSAQESVQGLEPILRASEAYGTDLALTSDLVTDSMSAMGIAVEDLGGYLDVVTKAQSSANASGQQMLEAYIGVGGVFKNWNVELDESAALLGVVANRGIKGSEAGTSMNAILMNLTKQSGQSYQAMQALGLSAYDTQGEFKGITAVLEEVQTATADLTQEQRDNYLQMIGGKANLDTLNALMSGLGEEYYELRESMQDVDGALMETAAIMNDTVQGAFARLSSATDDMKIMIVKQFGDGFKGMINKSAEFIPKITGRIVGGIQWMQEKAVPIFQNIRDKAVPVFLAVRDRAVAAFTFIRDTGAAAFGAIRAKWTEIQPHLQAFIGTVQEIGGVIYTKLQQAFEFAKPIITWVATTGLPAVVGIAGEVLGAISKVWGFFKGNWSKIKPIVLGIAGAFATYKAITIAVSTAVGIKTAAMTAYKTITVTLTAVQKTLNTVVNQNPFAKVAAVIGLVIAAGIALYENWDVVKEKAAALWEGIQGVFGGIADWFGGIWESVKEGFRAFINFIIGGLNKIPEGLNSLSVTIPSWVPGVGGNTLGFNVPTIPYLAQGGLVTGPTLAMVGEGGESEAVLPLSKLFAMLEKMGADGGGGKQVVLHVTNNFNGPTDKQGVEEANGNLLALVKQAIAQIELQKKRTRYAPA